MHQPPVVIIGSGIAGLWTALHAALLPVVLLAGNSLGGDASTGWAQGGIAAALGKHGRGAHAGRSAWT